MLGAGGRWARGCVGAAGGVLVVLSVAVFTLATYGAGRRAVISGSGTNGPIIVRRVSSARLVLRRTVRRRPRFGSVCVSGVGVGLRCNSHSFGLHNRVHVVASALVSVSVRPVLNVRVFHISVGPSKFAVCGGVGHACTMGGCRCVGGMARVSIGCSTVRTVFSRRLFAPASAGHSRLLGTFRLIAPAFLSAIAFVNGRGVLKTGRHFSVSRTGKHVMFAKTRGSSRPVRDVACNSLRHAGGVLFPEDMATSSGLNGAPIDVALSVGGVRFGGTVRTGDVGLAHCAGAAISGMVSLWSTRGGSRVPRCRVGATSINTVNCTCDATITRYAVRRKVEGKGRGDTREANYCRRATR